LNSTSSPSQSSQRWPTISRRRSSIGPVMHLRR
jgi:hypothetical protein